VSVADVRRPRIRKGSQAHYFLRAKFGFYDARAAGRLTRDTTAREYNKGNKVIRKGIQQGNAAREYSKGNATR